LYSDLDISYFADIHEKVHDVEKTLNKKCSSPDDGRHLIYAFAPLLAITPNSSPDRNNRVSIAPFMALPSKCAHGAMNVVEVLSDSSDEDDK
jgi:hypothetical protein